VEVLHFGAGAEPAPIHGQGGGIPATEEAFYTCGTVSRRVRVAISLSGISRGVPFKRLRAAGRINHQPSSRSFSHDRPISRILGPLTIDVEVQDLASSGKSYRSRLSVCPALHHDPAWPPGTLYLSLEAIASTSTLTERKDLRWTLYDYCSKITSRPPS
jgi:hypothetical protein